MTNHLADRALGWAQARVKNSDLDTYPAGLCRRVRLRKTSADAPLVIGRDTSGEEPNATSAALTLRFLAEYADADPSKVSACRPLAEEIGNWLLAMQVNSPGMPRDGGVQTAPGLTRCGTMTTAQTGIAWIRAAEVFGIGEYMAAAFKAAAFCKRMIDPNPAFLAAHGVAAIDTEDAVIIDGVDGPGRAEVSATGWSLMAVYFLTMLRDVSGEEEWVDTSVIAARDFMATCVTGHYDYYATKGDAAGVAAGWVKTNWTNQSSLDLNDNAWHRQGDAAGGNGTIGTDPQEYGLNALWKTGYDLVTLKAAYERMVGFPAASPTSPFGAGYDSRVCFTGYFRIDSPLYDGESKAFGSYYDSQGAGELLDWKKEYYPEHYNLSLPLVEAILHPAAGALLDENFQTVWSTDANGAFATQGVIPIMLAATALCTTGGEPV